MGTPDDDKPRRKSLREVFDLDPTIHYTDRERELAALDEGWANAALGLRTGIERFGHAGRRGLTLRRVFDWLEVRRQRVAAGETLDLLHAVKLCAEENVPMPRWLATQFIAAFDSFIALDDAVPLSLDEVFHASARPTTTKQKAHNAHRDWHNGSELYFEVQRVKAAHSSIDEALGAILGKGSRFGMMKTKARALVLRYERLHRAHFPGQTLSQYFAKRRKRS